MQQTDASLEMAALWRRVALLEEDNRQKTAQISDLLKRLDEIDNRFASLQDGNNRNFRADSDLNLVSLPDDKSSPIIGSESAFKKQPIPPTSSSLNVVSVEHIDLTPEPDSPQFIDCAFDDLHEIDIAQNPTQTRQAVSVLNVDDGADRDAVVPGTDQYDPVRELGLQPVLDALPEFLTTHLHRHQQIGAAFLSTVLKDNAGTIFADALGLGKTLQVLSALYLFCTGTYHKIAKPKLLILAPLTVVSHWADEVVRFNSWLGSGQKRFSDPFLLSSTMSASFRTDVLQRWAQAGGLLILSYSMFSEMVGRKSDQKLLRTSPGPDVVILDEGHRLCNNKSAIHNSLNVIRTQRRIVVSGYPLQNHLKELYSLMIFVNKPKCISLFKSKQNFTYLYEKVINGLKATKPDISKKRAFVLYEMIRKNCLFFRRDNQFLKQHLPPKTEIVITIRFSELQRSIWTSCLQKRNGLDGVTLHSVATMISDHPQIARRQADLEASIPCQEALAGVDPNQIDLEASGKMVLLMVLLQQCRAAGEKVVVFSRWIKALSFVEEMIERYNQHANSKINAFRFDGSTCMTERESLIKDFNSASSHADCFLISTLCGEGISLVAASRVVILEPNWNPSVDFQAAYRVYRIGQERPVFIYRLLMHEMFEDLVFQRQLEKIETASWIMDANNKEVANRVDTQWSEFVKEPPTLDRILGPSRVSLSDFALNDSITCNVINRLSLKSSNPFSMAPKSWIVSAVEHSKYFDDHAEIRQAPDLDSVMAFEELDYDRIYKHGTPARDSTLVDNVKRLTSVSVVDGQHSTPTFSFDERDPNFDDLNLPSTTSEGQPEVVKIPESCLKPIKPPDPNAMPASGFSYQVAPDVQPRAHVPSDDESWHAAVSLPERSPMLQAYEPCFDGIHPSRLSYLRSQPTSPSPQNDISVVSLKDDNGVPQTSTQVATPHSNGVKRRFEPVKNLDRPRNLKRPHVQRDFNNHNSARSSRTPRDSNYHNADAWNRDRSHPSSSRRPSPERRSSNGHHSNTDNRSCHDWKSSSNYSRSEQQHRRYEDQPRGEYYPRTSAYQPRQHNNSSERSQSSAIHTRF